MGKKKLSERDKEAIRESYLSSRQLAEMYDVHILTIRKLRTSKKNAYNTASDLSDNYGGNF